LTKRIFNYRSKNWHNADVDDVSLYFEEDRFYVILKGEFGENRFDVATNTGGADFLQALQKLEIGILDFTSHRTIDFEMEPQYVAMILKWCTFGASAAVPLGGINDLHKPNWEIYGDLVSRYEAYSDFKVTVNSRPWVVCLGRDGNSLGRVAIPVNQHDLDLFTYGEAKWELVSPANRKPETSEIGIVDIFDDGWIYVVREKNPNFLPVYEILNVSNSAEGIALWLTECESRRAVVDQGSSFMHSLSPENKFLSLALDQGELYEVSHTEKKDGQSVSDYRATFELYVAEWENYALAIRLSQDINSVEECNSFIEAFTLEKGNRLLKYEQNADGFWFSSSEFEDTEEESLQNLPNVWEYLGLFFDRDFDLNVHLKATSAESINRFARTLFLPFDDLNRGRWRIHTPDGQVLTTYKSEYRVGPPSEFDTWL
jgi:hypothetical protein